jgi:hypothetical protein
LVPTRQAAHLSQDLGFIEAVFGRHNGGVSWLEFSSIMPVVL